MIPGKSHAKKVSSCGCVLQVEVIIHMLLVKDLVGCDNLFFFWLVFQFAFFEKQIILIDGKFIFALMNFGGNYYKK